MLFCQIVLCFGVVALSETTAAQELSNNQTAAISSNCSRIKEVLKTVQTSDSRARVYLGSYYEKILNKYIIPLNLRLVKNNQSTPELVNAQTAFANYFTNFRDDYTDYQRTLENLGNYDCANHPNEFYDLLVETREKRSIMVSDVSKLRQGAVEYINLVKGLKNGER